MVLYHAERGLFVLLLFGAFVNFALTLGQVLTIPVVLSLSTSYMLGVCRHWEELVLSWEVFSWWRGEYASTGFHAAICEQCGPQPGTRQCNPIRE